jgi:hypothetical protein
MEMLGVRGVQLKWFTDYLSNRQQVVIYDNYRSDNYQVSYGVPQGSILWPLLFLVYIDDLSKVLKHSDVIMYADDTVLYDARSLSMVKLTKQKTMHIKTFGENLRWYIYSEFANINKNHFKLVDNPP